MIETRERILPEERERRRQILITAGPLLYGEHWLAALAAALTDAGHSVQRQRVKHWAVEATNVISKPIPAWLEGALRTLARERADQLRRDAAALDQMFSAGGTPAGSAPPAAEGGSPPAVKVAPLDGDDGVDLDALIEQALAHGPGPLPGSDFPVYVPTPPPPRPEGWRSAFAERYGYR